MELPFSDAAKHALHSSMEEADNSDVRTITPRHLLIGLLREQDCLAQKTLSELGVTLSTFGCEPVKAPTPAGGFTMGFMGARPSVDPEFSKVMNAAINEARLLSSPSIRPEHLLLGILTREESTAGKILREVGLDLDSLRRRLSNG
jgi:ATP-dependent Clp protease ATP-binding subunit ClpC